MRERTSAFRRDEYNAQPNELSLVGCQAKPYHISSVSPVSLAIAWQRGKRREKLREISSLPVRLSHTKRRPGTITQTPLGVRIEWCPSSHLTTWPFANYSSHSHLPRHIVHCCSQKPNTLASSVVEAANDCLLYTRLLGYSHQLRGLARKVKW